MRFCIPFADLCLGQSSIVCEHFMRSNFRISTALLNRFAPLAKLVDTQLFCQYFWNSDNGLHFVFHQLLLILQGELRLVFEYLNDAVWLKPFYDRFDAPRTIAFYSNCPLVSAPLSIFPSIRC